MTAPADCQPLLSIVVPAYNEEATLPKIVARLLAVPNAGEIVIVDDCSTDGTLAIASQLAAEHPTIKVAHHPRNQGKTEALKTGFSLTTGQIVIVQDADLEYDPAEIGDVIAPIVEGYADVVYGSRFLVRKASRVLYFYHYLGNKALTFLFESLHEHQHDRCRDLLQGVSRRDYPQYDDHKQRVWLRN